MKENLLFVTKGRSCEGVCYAMDLARSMNAGLVMLMVFEKQHHSFEDMMAAVAFAEAGDRGTVKELMEAEENARKEEVRGEIAEVTRRCKEGSVEFTHHIAAGDPLSAIKKFLKGATGIEMVLISPALLESSKLPDIRKLLREISRPVVTMSRPLGEGA